jgi:endoglucanase
LPRPLNAVQILFAILSPGTKMPSGLSRLLVFVALWQCLAVQASLGQIGASHQLTQLQAPARIGGILQNGTDWAAYKARFLDQSGRIVDTGNERCSHSEGQGYGMLLAVAAGDREAFDAIWSWTKTHLLIRKDNLAAWKWTGTPTQGVEVNNASDGDILIAWGLAEASDYWSEPAFFEAARRITAHILVKAVVQTDSFGPVLIPGAHGFSEEERADGPVINLSYWIYPAFQRLAQVEPKYDWNKLTKSGLALTEKARFGTLRLPLDWIAISGDKLAPAEGFNARFGYDSIRIPLYLFWGSEATPQRLSGFVKAWPADAPHIHLSAGGEGGQKAEITLREPGYRALRAIAHCAAMHIAFPDEFYHFNANQNYYPATLHLLSVIAARMQGGPCLNAEKARNLISDAWRPEPASLAAVFPQADQLRPGDQNLVEDATLLVNRNIPPDGGGEALLTVQDEMGPVYYFRVAAEVMIAVAAFIWVIQRKTAPPRETPVDEKEKLVSEAVSAIGPALEGKQLPLVPRTLPQSPFTTTKHVPTLAQEIEVAAAACVRLSRTIGLIYIEVPSFEALEKEVGPVEADAKVAALAASLRGALRATDNVAVLNRKEILVCICLLANASDLKNIAPRLYARLERSDLAAMGATFSPPGFAVYPLNGYEGMALIEAARADFRRNRPSREEPAPQTSAPAPEEKAHYHPSSRSTYAFRKRKTYHKHITPPE